MSGPTHTHLGLLGRPVVGLQPVDVVTGLAGEGDPIRNASRGVVGERWGGGLGISQERSYVRILAVAVRVAAVRWSLTSASRQAPFLCLKEPSCRLKRGRCPCPPGGSEVCEGSDSGSGSPARGIRVLSCRRRCPPPHKRTQRVSFSASTVCCRLFQVRIRKSTSVVMV